MGSGRRHAPSTIAFNALFGGIAMLATLLLLAPTVVVIVVSFTDGYSLKFPPPGYSLRWYEALSDAANTIRLATSSGRPRRLAGSPPQNCHG